MIVNNPSGTVFAGELGIEGGTLRLAALLNLTPGQYMTGSIWNQSPAKLLNGDSI